MTYAIMCNPRHGRVYLDAAGTMAVNELIFSGGLLSNPAQNIREADIGGVPYILFEHDGTLTAEDVQRLSRLSFAYALFELMGGDINKPGAWEEDSAHENMQNMPIPNEKNNGHENTIFANERRCLLAPIIKDHGYFIDEDISAILKYSGKTNELFTRLMLNLALAYVKSPVQPAHTLDKKADRMQPVHAYVPKSSPAQPVRAIDPKSNQLQPIRILDPMAGKGTTLYEALMQSCDAYGVEIDPKPAYESFVYIKKHFEMARYKHVSHTEKTSGTDLAGKKFTAMRYQVEMARSKEEQRAGQSRKFEMIAGDTRHVSAYYKKDFFHAIVADLPYGVQHSAKKKPQGGGFTRNALELLREAMPGWVKVLKPGGAVVLAWNLFLIDRDEMAKLFAQHGLAVQEGLDFSHRLDQATHRDLIIGIKAR